MPLRTVRFVRMALKMVTDRGESGLLRNQKKFAVLNTNITYIAFQLAPLESDASSLDTCCRGVWSGCVLAVMPLRTGNTNGNTNKEGTQGAPLDSRRLTPSPT